MPNVDCSLVPPAPLPPPPENQWFTMIVTLTIHDDLGNSAEAIHRDTRLFPQGVCGFGS
jgi:hypothetical protein